MKGEIPTSILNKYLQMGFHQQIIQMAWKQADNDNQMIGIMITLNEKNQQMQHEPVRNQVSQQDEDVMMNQIIMESLEMNGGQTLNFETMNPEERKRLQGHPVGLKNVGNTCYFNSLLQTYFYNSQFVKAILDFQPDPELQNLKADDPSVDPKTRISIQLVLNLQKLFVSLIASDKKYVDPSDVLKSICDDFGNHLPIGDQKDVGEFNNYFLSRVEDGLSHSKVQKNKMQEEQNQQQSAISLSPARSYSENLLNSSIWRQKSYSMVQSSLISRLFFGQYRQVFEFKEGVQLQCRESVEIFNFIPLDVKQKNLYDAMDHHIIQEIDDFKNDLNETVHAQKQNWIQSPPQTLFFQIQRVHYDKERNDLIKLNDQFNFSKKFYIDRFLYQNRNEYLQIRAKVIQIRNEQQQYTEKMQEISNYQGTKFNLINGFEQIGQFLYQQKNDLNGVSKQESDITQKVLGLYKDNLQKQYQEYNFKYQELENTIQDSYNNLKKVEYKLSQILIHDGIASYLLQFKQFQDSGHYYAYIFDNCLGLWFKFNDIYTNIIDEETVISDAQGLSNRNAYLLVYVKEDILKSDQDSMIPLRKYQLSTSQTDPDKYTSYLNKQQSEQIKMENLNFLQEIHDYKINSKLSLIVDSYNRRFEFVNEQNRVLKSKNEKLNFKPYQLLNLPIFVRSYFSDNGKGSDNKFDNIWKLMILDCAIRDQIQDDSIFSNSIKIEGLKKLMQQQFKHPKLPFTTQEAQEVKRFQTIYTKYISYAAKTVLMMEAFIEKKWVESIAYLTYLLINLEQDGEEYSYFKKLCFNKWKLLIISVILDIEENINYIIVDQIQIKRQLNFLGNFIVKRFKLCKETPVWRVQMSVYLADLQNSCSKQNDIENTIAQVSKSVDDEKLNPRFEEELYQYYNSMEEQINIYLNQYDTYNWSIDIVNDVLFDRLIKQFEDIKNQFKYPLLVMDLMKKQDFPVMIGDRKKFQTEFRGK